jgi:SsrA-binding protein
MKIYNKRVKHNYHILETVEAGVILTGPEVKSIRAGRVDLSDSFAKIQNNEVYLKNAYIYPYQGQKDDYDPRHDRKLLLHRTEIERLRGKVSGSATTLVPLRIYSTRNYMKVEIALAASKKKFDKKRALREKDNQRRVAQELSGRY